MAKPAKALAATASVALPGRRTRYPLAMLRERKDKKLDLYQITFFDLQHRAGARHRPQDGHAALLLAMIAADAWNKLVAQVKRARPLRGVRADTKEQPRGVIVSGDAQSLWRHPWFISAR